MVTRTVAGVLLISYWVWKVGIFDAHQMPGLGDCDCVTQHADVANQELTKIEAHN